MLIVEHSLPINLAADINSRDVGSDILNLNHYYYDDDGYKSDINIIKILFIIFLKIIFFFIFLFFLSQQRITKS